MPDTQEEIQVGRTSSDNAIAAIEETPESSALDANDDAISFEALKAQYAPKAGPAASESAIDTVPLDSSAIEEKTATSALDASDDAVSFEALKAQYAPKAGPAATESAIVTVPLDSAVIEKTPATTAPDASDDAVSFEALKTQYAPKRGPAATESAIVTVPLEISVESSSVAEDETSDGGAPTAAAVADASTATPATIETSPQDVPAFDPQVLRKRKLQHLKRRLLQTITHHKISILSSAASMLIGFGLASFALSGSEPTVEVVAVPPAVKFTATMLRRQEPISTVVPFEELEPEVVAIGKRLFHDSGLSGSGKHSCVSCHALNSDEGEEGNSQPVLTSLGFQRDIPAITNAALNFRQGWDGSCESLEAFLDSHFTKDGYMASDWERVLKVVCEDPLYFRSFQLQMNSEPTEKLVRHALSSYQRSLLLVNSPFDKWLTGDDQALNSDEIAGYYLFKQYNCISCHQGAGVGGTMVQPIGSLVDSLAPSTKEKDLGLFSSTGRERDKYVYRVPALRNVANTGPYFHDGSVKTLEEAVELMMKHELEMTPNATDIQRLTAFLKSLSGKPLEQVEATLLTEFEATKAQGTVQ